MKMLVKKWTAVRRPPQSNLAAAAVLRPRPNASVLVYTSDLGWLMGRSEPSLECGDSSPLSFAAESPFFASGVYLFSTAILAWILDFGFAQFLDCGDPSPLSFAAEPPFFASGVYPSSTAILAWVLDFGFARLWSAVIHHRFP
ncbi:MAG: hypothetical protein ACREHD_34645, partial [Pirellulales bacterium]